MADPGAAKAERELIRRIKKSFLKYYRLQQATSLTEVRDLLEQRWRKLMCRRQFRLSDRRKQEKIEAYITLIDEHKRRYQRDVA